MSTVYVTGDLDGMAPDDAGDGEFFGVNEDLTEEEENLQDPSITITRRDLRNFLDISGKMAGLTKEHCKYALFEVVEADGDNPRHKYNLVASAADGLQVSSVSMVIPILNTERVFKDKPLILRKGSLSLIERILDGNNFTIRVLEKDGFVDVQAMAFGGWIPVPSGAFSREVFFTPDGVLGDSSVCQTEDLLGAIRCLLPVARTQRKDVEGSISFTEGGAFVEDLGGHVHHAGAFFRHRVPVWAAEMLYRLVRYSDDSDVSVTVVTDRKSSYPYIRYSCRAFTFHFSRFGCTLSEILSPSMRGGISVDFSLLRSIASIPSSLKSELNGFYDGTLYLQLARQNGLESFLARLGCKDASSGVFSLKHSVFGDLDKPIDAKLPAKLVYDYFGSWKEVGDVCVACEKEGSRDVVQFKMGKWSCCVYQQVDA